MNSVKPSPPIGGRFRVESVLGEGGMGTVYLARNLGLDQLVAIKVLLPEVASDPDRKNRLVREARAAAKIKSEHVVRVFDVVAEGPDSPFVVMEYLQGESLRDCLDRRGQLPLEEVLEIVAQIAEAIGEGHALGIVHRDIKPENVFLVRHPSQRPFCKVLDFGISKLRGTDAVTLTSSQEVLASPAYAAPEQLRKSRDANAPADIWSLGVLMYECLVGCRPFDAETLAELCVQILEETPGLPSQLSPALPKAVDSIVTRCLAKEPEQRFSSISELLHACLPLAERPCGRALNYLSSIGVSIDAAHAAHNVETSAAGSAMTTVTGVRSVSSLIPVSEKARMVAHPIRATVLLLAVAALAGGLGWKFSLNRAARRESKAEAAALVSSSPVLATDSAVPFAPPLTSTKTVDAGSNIQPTQTAGTITRPAAAAPRPRPHGQNPAAVTTGSPSLVPTHSPRWAESR